MTEPFFHAGGIYRHHLDGTPSSESLFVVVHVSRAPEGFAHPAETGDVAFGWRRATAPDGTPTPWAPTPRQTSPAGTRSTTPNSPPLSATRPCPTAPHHPHAPGKRRPTDM
ncbi:hypothetical protein AB0442_42440 [Kitasatospora sp. NPDC085895]|uniref:hypothetical protein n=1 Tax=Kitasatospora sp. NPDC085895 TaxID=3155057 RepID=UPI00344F5C5B